MQRLRNASKNGAPRAAAAAVLATVPQVMRFLRAQMRQRREAGLTVPQFRALIFVHHHPHARLAALAEHIGISPAAASRMVDHLVTRRLMVRKEGRQDRRAVALQLTARGQAAFDEAYRGVRGVLADRLGELSPVERGEVIRAMGLLGRFLGPDAPTRTKPVARRAARKASATAPAPRGGSRA